MAVEKWRKICDNFKIQTTVVPATEFLQQNYSPLKSWLGKFEFYSQNYLSLRMSHKWPVLLDPHNLGEYSLFSNVRVSGINELMIFDDHSSTYFIISSH